MPRVSVLLPVRDAEPHLEACLRSVRRQTFGDFEVVAVDDGSTDGSGWRLEAAAVDDPRFRVVRRPPEGLVAALEAGLELCRGELVARMDADDVMARRRLEAQVAAADATGADVVSCLVRHVPRGGVSEGFRRYETWLNGLRTHDEIVRERFVESPIPHPSALLRRRALDAVGGYRDRGWPEDYDLWLRLAAAGARFHKVPELLLLWRHHPGRATRTDPRYDARRFLACKAHHLVRGPLRDAGRIIVWGAGLTGRRLSTHLLREGAEIEAFVDIRPDRIGGTLRDRPIHPPEDLPALARDTRTVVVTAVAAPGGRGLIRERLDGWGLREGVDYWCAA